jgi:hypothetical protein
MKMGSHPPSLNIVKSHFKLVKNLWESAWVEERSLTDHCRQIIYILGILENFLKGLFGYWVIAMF